MRCLNGRPPFVSPSAFFCTSLIFVFLVLGIGSQQAMATHALGAEINYSCLGPNRYEVKLKFYRDCNGISIGSSQTVTYSSATCNVSSSISVSQVGPAVDIILPRCVPHSPPVAVETGRMELKNISILVS